MRPTRERGPFWLAVSALLATLALALLLEAAPTRIAGGPDLLPQLPLIALYIWSIRRPGFVSPPVLLLTGLAQDLMTGAPMGVWSLAYLVAFAVARDRAADGFGAELGPTSARFAALAAVAFLIAGGAGAFAVGAPGDIAILGAELALTVLLFPVFAWAFARRRERATFS